LRKNLIAQFLTESLLISLIALVIAILIAWLALPFFNQLAGKQIHFSYLLRPAVLAVLLPGALAVGFLAGVYPAFILSAFQPIDVLKGSIAKGFRGSRMRNILVVFQFAISIVLIVGTLVIYSQLSYIRNKDLGFNRQQVLVIKNTRVLKEQAKVFK
jgi:putative ABC transport system permease protein